MRWRAFALGLVVLAAALAGGAYLWLRASFAAPGPASVEIVVEIPRGAGSQGIAERLRAAGAIDRRPEVFALGLRLFGDRRPLRAGEYALAPGASMADIARQMQEGRVLVRKLTVPEGLTVAQVLALVAAEPALAGDLPPPPPEGTLLPETYAFVRGDSRAGVVQRMADAMRDALAEAMPRRAEGLPYADPQAVLTLASIVEKETAVAAERPRVAGVFVNRLRLGMRLQSDPTVIYGITLGAAPLDRPLTRADLDRATAYNTYVIAGLPPGPIANPGRASIEAVLRPLATEDLYFVADGSGGHAFAKTLDEHNANVRRWRRLQQQAPSP